MKIMEPTKPGGGEVGPIMTGWNPVSSRPTVHPLSVHIEERRKKRRKRKKR